MVSAWVDPYQSDVKAKLRAAGDSTPSPAELAAEHPAWACGPTAEACRAVQASYPARYRTVACGTPFGTGYYTLEDLREAATKLDPRGLCFRDDLCIASNGFVMHAGERFVNLWYQFEFMARSNDPVLTAAVRAKVLTQADVAAEARQHARAVVERRVCRRRND